VQGAGFRVDGDDATVEVDVVALEAGEFAPVAAGPGGGDDEQSGGGAAEYGCLFGDPYDVFGHREDFLRAGGGVVPSTAAAASSLDWVGGDEVLVDRVVEHHGEHGEDLRHGGGGVAFAQVFQPDCDVD
jgi:hypothetical protein